MRPRNLPAENLWLPSYGATPELCALLHAFGSRGPAASVWIPAPAGMTLHLLPGGLGGRSKVDQACLDVLHRQHRWHRLQRLLGRGGQQTVERRLPAQCLVPGVHLARHGSGNLT